MPVQPPTLNRPIAERIAWACRCYRETKAVLLEDRVIKDLLFRLKGAVEASRREMQIAGVVAVCRDCEERDGGSCCGAGIENHFGSLLLLINLLLGAQIPERRTDPSSCRFLTPAGCSLCARHTLCVNYLCSKASKGRDPQKIAALRNHEGVELETLFTLQEHLHKVIRAL